MAKQDAGSLHNEGGEEGGGGYESVRCSNSFQATNQHDGTEYVPIQTAVGKGGREGGWVGAREDA